MISLALASTQAALACLANQEVAKDDALTERMDQASAEFVNIARLYVTKTKMLQRAV